MHTVTKALHLSWEVHDNWTEILAGTYFILNGPLEETTKKIPAIILARNVIITSHQLVEVMFFNTVRKYIDDHKSRLSSDVITEIENGFKKNRNKTGNDKLAIIVGGSFLRHISRVIYFSGTLKITEKRVYSLAIWHLGEKAGA